MATVTRRLAALLGASGAGLTDSATSSQITTTSLKDDAVTSAKIGTDQVGADALSSSAIAGAADIPANSVGESELSIDLSAQSVPHIIPGVLQPAVAGKLLNGANHSGAYGTAQTQSGGDGHKYYYTDIKGSKPIKDPRIGAHFGSQRHKFKSLQLLEQETATHGENVYSVDGREWCRLVGTYVLQNNDQGNVPYLDGDGTYVEITGYFSEANLISLTYSSGRDYKWKIDGGSYTTKTDFNTSANSPLTGRYVDGGSVANIGISQTLGIHTLQIMSTGASEDPYVYGIELIAQDTTSTANRSKIQIPAQNVVSFGKKFPISATSVHYDPFTTMSYGGSGTTLSNLQSLIDTATSLGMDNWKAGGSNYHRPWNGGRVIKWVDSSGVIKTSVNMMPPNAQNIGTTASNAVSDAHVIAGTNDDTINFNTSAIDHSQAEVAKTFLVREFGNGSANAGTAAGSYRDPSMLSTTTNDVTYIMDDGLTSLSADGVQIASTPLGLHLQATNDFFTVAFIGTGLTIVNNTDFADSSSGLMTKYTLAQNLPYGTHILEHKRAGTYTSSTIKIDGVQVHTGWIRLEEVIFHQPKKPPIPEDAVVLADYMLMADFVVQGADGIDKISKGTRRLDASRDMFYNGSSLSLEYNSINYRGQTRVYSSSNNKVFKIPSFGRGGIVGFYGAGDKAQGLTFKINGTIASGTTNYNHYGLGATGDSDFGTFDQRTGSNTAGKFLGAVHKTEISAGGVELSDTTTEQMTFESIDLVTPIHTSSHYQPFETPFLHELVGGDRNMEQTNLVVSPDGKTWDQVTRDTSYIGNIRFTIGKAATVQSITTPLILDQFRGTKSTEQFEDYMTKDFAIAYDRFICLVDGQYEIRYWTYVNSNTGAGFHRVLINGQIRVDNYTATLNTNSVGCHRWVHLKRGDYVQIGGTFLSTMSSFQIIRV